MKATLTALVTFMVVIAVVILAALACGLMAIPTPTATPVSTLEPPSPPTPIPTLAATHTAVPTWTPTPAVSDIDRYIAEVVGVTSRIGNAFTDFSVLCKAPRLGEADWTFDVIEQASIIRALHEELVALDVPPEMAEIHTALLAGTADYYTAMDYVITGVNTLNPSDFDAANTLIMQGNAKVDTATALLEEY